MKYPSSIFFRHRTLLGSLGSDGYGCEPLAEILSQCPFLSEVGFRMGVAVLREFHTVPLLNSHLFPTKVVLSEPSSVWLAKLAILALEVRGF